MTDTPSSKGSSADVQNPADPDQPDQALEEFKVMLRYVLSEGLEMDDQTLKDVVPVQELLRASGDKPLAEVPGMIDHVMAAHSALSRIIAPATPLSLAATEPGPILGYLGNPPLIMWMILIALVSAVGFLVTGGVLSTYPNSILAQKLNWCFAAALGAVFYVLFTSLNYVKDRTYDPRYNSIYVIRFVLGVLAGLILAVVLETSLFNSSSTIKNLGPAVIALLGGFSTEAVYQILQRMVDLLLAAVRGDDSAAAKAKATDAARNELLKLADDPSTPDAMKSKVLAAAKKVGA
ncbi:MAG: hypothetical protein ABSD98_08990 [Candidatus Korobacteraceae bacterium]